MADNNRFPSWVVFICVGGAILVAWLIGFFGPGSDQFVKAKIALAYGVLILIFLFGLLLVRGIARGVIDISGRLSEYDSNSRTFKASMSRFQLLIFIFVIGVSFFYIVLCDCTKFPEVPGGVMALLGISASTYGVSKGIQASKEDKTSVAPTQNGQNPTGGN